MKIKDPIKFVGGIDKAKSLIKIMEQCIKSHPPLRNCWVSYGGDNQCFITPYKCTYSVSYKNLKELINESRN